MYYSNEDRSVILQFFYKNNKNACAAQREYARTFPDRPVPDRKTFRNIAGKFQQNFSVMNRKRRNEDNEDGDFNVVLYFEEHPRKSIRDAARDLEMPRSCIQRILNKHKYKDFKFKPVQKLYPEDFENRLSFCQLMINRFNEDNDIFRNILWTDEATFTTAGMFNRKNNHMWSHRNPHAFVEIKKQGRRSINVWCGILDTHIYYFFFEGSLTATRYLQFLRTNVEEFLSNIPLERLRKIIWQQDGAPCHYAACVTNYLNENYREWIGRNGTILWPARSPDLTPPDFFLWGYLKDNVYKHRNDSILEIQQRITLEIENLNNNLDILRRVTNNIRKRYLMCINENGHHIDHLLV